VNVVNSRAIFALLLVPPALAHVPLRRCCHRRRNLPQNGGPGLVPAAIGETVTVDGPRVTPLEVLADSRCPQEVRCVWEGEVRLNVRIDLGAGIEVREITSRSPSM
jgi:hypothetical protein